MVGLQLLQEVNQPPIDCNVDLTFSMHYNKRCPYTSSDFTTF
jgi:hypothetical protein